MGNHRGTGVYAVHNMSREEMDSDRIAGERARIAEGLLRAMFPFVEQRPSEVKEVIGSREAAEFLSLLYSSFREIAPRYLGMVVMPQRFVCLQSELLPWLLER